MRKIIEIRNIVVKSILVSLGVIAVLSVFWGFILQGFNLNTSDVKEWGRTEFYTLALGFSLAVGGAYYNTILDSLMNFLKKITN